MCTHLVNQLHSLKPKLTELYERVEKECEEHLGEIPHPREFDVLNKLGETVWTSDCCHTATATRNSLDEKVPTRKTLEEKVSGTNGKMDCHLHMRNTSFCNPTEKALSADLRNLLRDSLDDIDSRLRVGTPHTAFARSYDKEFSQCCNYWKGGGEFCLAWLKKNTKGRLVWYMENVHRSCMDIVFISAVSMYMNRKLDV